MDYLLEISVDGIYVKLRLEEMGYPNKAHVESVAEKLGGECCSVNKKEE